MTDETRTPAAEKMPDAEKLAKLFHDTYERLATRYGYKTREETSVPWPLVPTDNKRLMIATCEEVLFRFRSDLAPSNVATEAQLDYYQDLSEKLQAKVKELEAEIGCLQSPVDYPDYPNEAYWELAEQATRYRTALENIDKAKSSDRIKEDAEAMTGSAGPDFTVLLTAMYDRAKIIASEALAQTQEGEGDG